MEWKERATELHNNGSTDHEISIILLEEFGIHVAEDTIRYHTRRKHKKDQIKEEQSNKGISKTLVISDLHIPFHREQEIINIILKHRNEIDTILFAGDIVDMESISVYPKECRISLIAEMIVAYKLLRRIDKLTPNVKKVLHWGNHEYRFVKYLAVMKSEFNPLHSDNILGEIVGGFTYYDKVNKKKYTYPPLSDNFKVINKWYYQHGDAIFAHPMTFSKVHLKTVVSAVEHFLEKGFVFNVLFIGHTHKWGHTFKLGKWCGELGCLCQAMEYSDTGHLGYTPQRYGYLLLTQVHGVTDINASQLYELKIEDGENEWQEREPDLE